MAKLSVKRFEDLAEAQTHYLRQVDSTAEQVRLRYITPGAGQAMTYEQKYREAVAGDGPLLQAEANALGLTVSEVAQSVLDAHAAWQIAGARIEGLRLKAKADIRKAATAAEMHDVVEALSFS